MKEERGHTLPPPLSHLATPLLLGGARGSWLLSWVPGRSSALHLVVGPPVGSGGGPSLRPGSLMVVISARRPKPLRKYNTYITMCDCSMQSASPPDSGGLADSALGIRN